jgi:hypothetical protein
MCAASGPGYEHDNIVCTLRQRAFALPARPERKLTGTPIH